MKYTVVWQPSALRRLAELWNAGPDRAEITTAADAIDQLLRHDPAQHGEARTGTGRVVIYPPLAVYFKVAELDRLVTIAAVWRWTPSP